MTRRIILLLTPLRSRLLQHIKLRDCPRIWQRGHGFRFRKSRSLARAQRRLEQLWYRHTFHGSQLSLKQNLERLPLYALELLPSRKSVRRIS